MKTMQVQEVQKPPVDLGSKNKGDYNDPCQEDDKTIETGCRDHRRSNKQFMDGIEVHE
jgi:hypothetical protein